MDSVHLIPHKYILRNKKDHLGRDLSGYYCNLIGSLR